MTPLYRYKSMKNTAKNILLFKGFASPRYTQVPDELFDELMSHLSGAELKVLLYIIRRTFGFKKDSDNISLSQICNGIKTRDGETLDMGTGLSLSTVQIALKGLIDKRCVLAIKNRSAEKGDEPTTFSLNTLTYTEYRQGGIPNIGNGGYRKSVSQETVLQETVLQNRNSREKYQTSSKVNKEHHDFQKIGVLLKEKVHKDEGTHETITKEAPDAIKVAVEEISKEFGERRSARSNLTHVMNIFQQSGKNINTFSTYLYEARSVTKQQENVKKKMPYFFSVLEDILNLKKSSFSFSTKN